MKSWYISVLVVVVVGMLGGVLPTWQENKVLQTELEMLVNDLEERTQELQALETQGAEEQQRQKEIAQRIPVTLDQAEVLRDVYAIAQSSGFSFEGIQFRRGKNAETEASELHAQFQAKGGSDRVVNFLTAIERNSPFFGLSSLHVNRDPETEMATLQVDIYTYSLQ